MKKQTYEEVYKEWKGNTKLVTYKIWSLLITVIERTKDNSVFYIGELSYSSKKYTYKRTSFESIHYDKVVSRFQRFVDEYCTDWVVFSDFQYKGYRVFINKEKDRDFYIGIVQFHKNSTYKHIADTREEVERCCKNRIDKVVKEKEKMKTFIKPEFVERYSYKGYELEITYEPTMKYPYLGKEPYVGRVNELRLSWRGKTPEDIKKQFREYFDKKGMGRTVEEEVKLTPKQEKIQELEQLQARISAQIEELKKEKDTLTYKGVVLDCEQGKNDTWVFVGEIRNAPKNVDVRTICGDSLDEIQRDLEEYVDWLEEKAYLYNHITGK